MRIIRWLTILAVLAPAAFAAIQTRDVDYRDGDVELQGYLAYDDASTAHRPGVVIFHEWKGPGPYERGRAEQLAQLGCVAFVADVYGNGVRPTTPDECRAEATKYRSDRRLMRARARAALDELKKQEMVDPARVAAIGYCFGGTVALELARSGAKLRGVVSFHGGLDSPNPEDAKHIQARVLVLHGADDPTTPPEMIAAFQDEMRKGGVDWEFVLYGGARHAFSNPAAGNDPTSPVAYNEKADQRSWVALRIFLDEIFR
ncbi:MAG: dienelactone hydrolase family protein [Verrucomicrobiota bacterium]